jgi:hypothetical protein
MLRRCQRTALRPAESRERSTSLARAGGGAEEVRQACAVALDLPAESKADLSQSGECGAEFFEPALG